MATQAPSRRARSGSAASDATAAIQTEEALRRALLGSLPAVSWISASDPMLQIEAGDAVRARARALGYTERSVQEVGSGFNPSLLIGETRSMSLFGDRRLIELRLRGKPHRDLGEALGEIGPALDESTRILVHADRPDGQQMRANWFRLLQPHLLLIDLMAPTPAQFPRWLQQRLQRQGQKADDTALALLAERTEGNLLAASQALNRLALLAPPGLIDGATIEQFATDSAQYEVFALADTALSGDGVRLLRILDSLEASKAPLPLLVWALDDTLRRILRAQQAMAEGQPLSAALRAAHIFGARETLWAQALHRIHPVQADRMLRETAYLDRMVKGVASGAAWIPGRDSGPADSPGGPSRPWAVVERIVLGLAGLPRLPL